ncbi:MAG: DUF1080 domain-containing protein [bacterium]|nr:DUF1080 domain-containing protein [bacterium]
MRRILPVLVAVSIAAVTAGAAKKKDEPLPRPVGTLTPAPAGDGWIDLFDASHQKEWKLDKPRDGIFAFEDGVMHISGHKPTRYIGYMKETFSDFQLHVEFKVTKDANSGVLFRADPSSPPYTGMEIQVYDDHGKPPSWYGCGALYDVASPMFNMSNPAGEWNSLDITLKGKHLVTVMNGWKVLDVDLSVMKRPVGKFKTPYDQLSLEGHLFLQDHGNELWYRNVRIKKL